MLLISIHLACMLKKNMSISNYLCHAYYEPGNAIDSGLTPGSEDSLEKEWLPTPVFLHRKPHGQRSLEGCTFNVHFLLVSFNFINILVTYGYRAVPSVQTREKRGRLDKLQRHCSVFCIAVNQNRTQVVSKIGAYYLTRFKKD